MHEPAAIGIDGKGSAEERAPQPGTGAGLRKARAMKSRSAAVQMVDTQGKRPEMESSWRRKSLQPVTEIVSLWSYFTSSLAVVAAVGLSRMGGRSLPSTVRCSSISCSSTAGATVDTGTFPLSAPQ